MKQYEALNQQEVWKNTEGLLYLIRCVLRNEKPAEERLEAMDLNIIKKLARDHSLDGMLAVALEQAGLSDEWTGNARGNALRKVMILDQARAELNARLEEAGIWYMPLKGVLLKDYYPGPGLRQMTDNDILFDASRTGDVKEIMLSLGYKPDPDKFGLGHHDAYYRPPVVNMEMHRSLFNHSNPDGLVRYFEKVEERLLTVEGRFERHFTPEDFYLYILGHAYKHYVNRGTGLRILTDVYCFLEKDRDKLDWPRVQAAAEQIGFAFFEATLRQLTFKLFGPEPAPPTEKEKDMLLFMLSSGSYGNLENKVKGQTDGSFRSRMAYIKRRIFLPLPVVKETFPYFAEHKILLPLLPFFRIGRALVKRPRQLLKELKLLHQSGRKPVGAAEEEHTLLDGQAHE